MSDLTLGGLFSDFMPSSLTAGHISGQTVFLANGGAGGARGGAA